MTYEEAVVIGSAALTYIFFWLSTKLNETQPEEPEQKRFNIFRYLTFVFFFVGLAFAMNTVALMYTVASPTASAETNSTIGTEMVILSWTQNIVYLFVVVQLIIIVLLYFDIRKEMRWQNRK